VGKFKIEDFFALSDLLACSLLKTLETQNSSPSGFRDGTGFGDDFIDRHAMSQPVMHRHTLSPIILVKNNLNKLITKRHRPSCHFTARHFVSWLKTNYIKDADVCFIYPLIGSIHWK